MYKYKLIYTPEQAEKIVAGDIEARNKFYFDNYELLHILATAYVMNRSSSMGGGCDFFEIDDLMNQAYLDLPYLNYKTVGCFIFGLRNLSFRLSYFGGYSYMRENNCLRVQTGYLQIPTMSTDVMNGESECLPVLDLFCSCSPFDEFFDHADNFDYAPALRSILARYLKPLQVEFVLLVCEGYSQAEACRKIGARSMSFSALSKRLRAHYAEIVDKLLAFGCSSAEAYFGVVPSDKPAKRVYKLSEEERAKARENIRKLRARKRAEKLALEGTETAEQNTEKAPKGRGRKKAV